MEATAFRPRPGSMAWFEIGTTDPQTTIDFYGEAFGWRFEKDETAGGKPYFNIFTGGEWPAGRLWDHSASKDGGDYAMPSILVTDVPATAAAATVAGARVEHGPEANPDGLVFARLRDPHGNRFGLFSMPTHTS
ncbi:VOC family protein [Streptomyces sp. NPDC058701]|uniref:VOC family protein n=1 Tax=Streptomyces sp. NPDC058701 TaxID=3346608 RepID=UPI00365921DC